VQVDRNVRDTLVANLERRLDLFHKDALQIIRQIAVADTVEGIMERKRCLLQFYVRRMPTGVDECYFCLHHKHMFRAECGKECAYAAVHGWCMDMDSTYRKIMNCKSALIESLELYYAGEQYGGEQKCGDIK